MKKILITGANSYIGTSFENYINDYYPGAYIIDTVDMIDENWRDKSFAGYDSVFHVAGIVHSDSGNVSKDKADLYYSVNTDLTIETAKKAKADGVRQFIFMSSIVVYGSGASIGDRKLITKDSKVNPDNCYGDSKVRAENGILPLNDDQFKVVILRPPMIYGKGSKGNYPRLSKFAQKLPVFPYVQNERSMLYIENLCEFVRLMIDNNETGIFYPQNDEYSNTSELVQMIAEVHGKKLRLVKGFTWILKLMSYKIELVNKAFGSFCYEKDLSRYPYIYQKFDLKSSIYRAENKDE